MCEQSQEFNLDSTTQTDIQTTFHFLKNKFQNNFLNIQQVPTNQKLLMIQQKLEKYFNQNISPNSIQSAASYPKKSRQDISLYSGSGGYFVLYVQLFKFYREQGDKKHEEFYKENALISLKQIYNYINQNKNEKRFTYMSGPQGFIVHAIEFFLIQNIYSNAINCLDLLIQSALKIKQADQKKESIYYEVLYGVSGFLYVLNYVYKLLSNQENKDIKNKYLQEIQILILDFVQIIYEKGFNSYGKSQEEDLLNQKIIAQDFRLVYYFHDKEYIGGAHGLFGVLNIMMQSILLLDQQFLALPKSKYILKSIELSLNFLLSYQQKNGNFPSSFNSKKSGNNSLCQFCHGSPGAVNPLIQASELFKNQKYLNSALQCGQNVWEQGILKKGFGLCHGISGNGYAFLSLYKATNNQQWMNKAKLFGQIWEIKQYMDYINNYELEDRYVVGKPDYPFSMFQGIVGDILYLVDLQQPKQFQFLGYTL